jgi:hypothetical protein
MQRFTRKSRIKVTPANPLKIQREKLKRYGLENSTLEVPKINLDLIEKLSSN